MQNPLDYSKAVKEIRNETDLTKLDLANFLPAATVMVITVTSSTTSGQPLSQEELNSAIKGCDMILSLDQAKRKVTNKERKKERKKENKNNKKIIKK